MYTKHVLTTLFWPYLTPRPPKKIFNAGGDFPSPLDNTEIAKKSTGKKHHDIVLVVN